MAKQWFTVNVSDDVIRGFHRSSKATALPADTASETFHEVTNAQYEDWATKRREMTSDGQNGVVLWDTGNISKQNDVRPMFRLEIFDPPNRTDIVTETAVGTNLELTFSKIVAGSVDTGFNLARKLNVFDRRFRLTFSNGVAVKNWSPNVSGQLEWRNDEKVRVEGKVVKLDVYE